MSDYTPDNWVVLRIDYDGNIIYKVLAGWSGGYLDGDSWRINSGITRVEQDGDYWNFYGSSGSCYSCHKNGYRLTMATSGIHRQLCERFGGYVQLMDENTDWTALEYA